MIRWNSWLSACVTLLGRRGMPTRKWEEMCPIRRHIGKRHQTSVKEAEYRMVLNTIDFCARVCV